MDAVAASQEVPRWVLYDPDNVLPHRAAEGLHSQRAFLHIIRDGRDIALSLKKMGGFRPLPWDGSETRSLVATALYWEWMVRNGHEHGSRFPSDYMEIHYEDLITQPRETCRDWAAFLTTISTTTELRALASDGSRSRTLPSAKKPEERRSTPWDAGKSGFRAPMWRD